MDDAPPDSGPIAARYALSRVIGSGATAVVHEGRDLVTGQPVAVKLYRAGGTVQHRIQQQREIAALTQLRHPGLIALHDCGTEPGHNGRTYLVTDLVEGPSLRARLLDGPLSARSVYELTGRLATALAYVHAHGFLHRDIKPANILLADGHEPRLADFGIARALDGTIATATGAVAGTAAYLAPEQVRGGPVEPAADVYALGLVLLEALTGRLEYPGSVVEAAVARLHRRPVVPQGLPWNLTALLEAMTDPDPATRPTAAAVARAVADPPDTSTADPAPPRLATAEGPAEPPTPAALATANSPVTASAGPASPPPATADAPAARPSAAAVASPLGPSADPALPPSATAEGLAARDRLRRRAPLLAVVGLLLAVLLGGVSLLVTTGRTNNAPTVGAAPAVPAGQAGGTPTAEPVATSGALATVQPVVPVAAEKPAGAQPLDAQPLDAQPPNPQPPNPQPRDPQPVAADTRRQADGGNDAQSSPAEPAHVATPPDAAATEDAAVNADDKGNGNAKGNGNGKAKGNGKGNNGNGGGNGNGNGKKDE